MSLADLVVGAGILQFPGQPHLVLMGRRQGNPVMQGLWEFPGGKVEGTDRTVRDAVAREWLEELGLAVEVGELVGLYEATYSTGRRLFLRTYRVRGPAAYRAEDAAGLAFYAGLTLRARPDGPHSALTWVDFRHAIASLPCTPSTHATWSQDHSVGILMEPW